MDSEIGLPGKGRAEISGIALIRATKKWRWVITVCGPDFKAGAAAFTKN